MKFYKPLLLPVLFLCACQSSGENNSWWTEIDAQMPSWLELYNTPGAVMAIIDEREVVLQKGYGFADKESRKSVDLHTGFNIGSISKTITAWGIMYLVEKGRISLDDPVEKHINSWKLPDSSFDHSEVTVGRLLSHTAGISLHGFRGFSLGDSIPGTVDFLNRPARDGKPVVRVALEPGTDWRYSGGGYLILQLLIEEVTGMPFEDFMDKEVLSRLGMTRSSFKITDGIVDASSSEYSTLGDKIDFQVFAAKAAAGFQTDIVDFTRFALINLGIVDSNLLSESTVRTVMTAQPASGGQYGLGYQIEVLPDSTTTLFGHAGANFGWHAWYRINPDTKDGFVLFTNSGYGWNVYRRAYCDWVKAKTGLGLGEACQTSIMATMIKPLKEVGVKAALARYDSLMNASPDLFSVNAGQLVSLSGVLMRENKPEEALTILEFNLDRFPDHAANHLAMGDIYQQQGEKAEAKKSYEQCLKIDPENARAKEKLMALD